MKYLLFDQSAIATYVSRSVLQSIEYIQGKRLVEHICGIGESEILEDVYVEYNDDGILFVGKRNAMELRDSGDRIFCVDLMTCNILTEKNNPSDLLTIFQKIFRTVLKIWNRQPFSSSERVNKTKSIVFPFVMPDHRRIVIERSNNIERLTKRKISFPLLAYKYCAEDPHGEETVNTSILCKAGEEYVSRRYQIQRLFPTDDAYNSNNTITAFGSITGGKLEGKDNFAYWNYDTQYANLTEAQKYVVDFSNLDCPLRVDGAAGTGKTLSLLMRAYRLLVLHQERKQPFRIIFFSHSASTCEQVKMIFCNYPLGSIFLNGTQPQNIQFITLLEFCKDFSKIAEGTLLEADAGEAKTYQLMLIEEVLEKAKKDFLINTYRPLLSKKLQEIFEDLSDTGMQEICPLLQHEFSVQIKGRTDCTLESYKDIPSIANGLYCEKEIDKEFV